MSRRRFLFVGLLLTALVGAGLGTYFVTDGRGSEGKGKGKGTPAVPVTIAVVQQQVLPVRLQAIGNVEAFASVAVKARVDGQIMEVNFREGQPVKKNDILLRIDPRPFQAALRQAEANALRDRAARDQARSQEKRYMELMQKGFISKEAYGQFRTNAETAEATAKASQAALENARLSLEYCTILSPLDGYVGRALLQAGNQVRANDATPLVVINQVRPIYVNFSIPEQTLPEVRKRMAAAPLVTEVLPVDPAQPVTQGTLIFVDNAVDPSTGTIRLRAQFDNQDALLWPGQFVTVSLRLYNEANALVVPATAVQTGPDGQYVYVVGDEMTVDLRKVTVSRTDGDHAIIASGVAKGERVVTRGQLRLGPKTRVQVGKPGAEPS